MSVAMNFTPAQKQAIETSGCSLLVAAGAGSGKTAVLTERILRRVACPDDPAELTDFLIVTFTNAAAKEMKERLVAALSREVAEHPDNKKALRAIAAAPLARISTIDSFCLDLVRRNFQKCGLPAELRILDAAEAVILKQRLLDAILDEEYEKKGAAPDVHEDKGPAVRGDAQANSDFLFAVEAFSGAKSDQRFAESLLHLYEKLSSLAEPFVWLDRQIERYESVAEDAEFFGHPLGQMVRDACVFQGKEIIDDITELYGLVSTDDVLAEKYAPSVACDLEFYQNAVAALSEGYETARQAFANFSPTPLKPCRNYEDKDFLESAKSTKAKCAERFFKLRSNFLEADTATVAAAAQDTARIFRVVRGLLWTLDQRFSAKKRERGLLDFQDVERYALLLLTDCTDPFVPSAFARETAREIREIYIDEYQDINQVQDLIFRAVSTYCDGQECNRFLVGDVKQSIYRFRGADPSIFRHYMETFSEVQENSAVCRKLYLSDNFRCSLPIISFVNHIFRSIMPEEYGDREALVYAKKENDPIADPVELMVCEPDDNQEESGQAEARMIAEQILAMAKDHTKLSADGCPYSYGDFAVLLRSTSDVELYRRELERVGIPVDTDVPENFFHKPEILLCLCLLRSIDNPERDIFLAGYVRSELGGLSDEELAVIRRLYGDVSFYRALVKFSQEEQGKELEPTRQRVVSLLHKLKEYRAMARGLSADRLIWRLYRETGLLTLCASERFSNPTKQDGIMRRKNLYRLYEAARAFEKTAFHGLGAFLEYLDDLARDGKSIAGATGGEKKDKVHILTIHRSKGLEFPVCFLAQLDRRFNTQDERENLVFSPAHGIAAKLRDTADCTAVTSGTGCASIDTPFREAIIHAERMYARTEEKRILYVAMTRAKERLILTAQPEMLSALVRRAYTSSLAAAGRDGCGASRSVGRMSSSYLEWILEAIAGDRAAAPLMTELAGYAPTSDQLCGIVHVQIDPHSSLAAGDRPAPVRNRDEVVRQGEGNGVIHRQAVDQYYNVIDSFFRFQYPFSGLSRLAAKLSVSQLKIGLVDEDDEGAAILGSSDARSEDQTRQDPVPVPSAGGGKEMPDFVRAAEHATGAERGTALHMFLQFADYAACETSGAQTEGKRLLSQGFLTEKQESLLPYHVLDSFFESSFYAEIKRSPDVKRELRFNLMIPAAEFDGSLSGQQAEFVLVQGVIDCFFENADGSYTVVDFKTDAVQDPWGESALIRRHGAQLGYYCRAVQEMTGKKVTHAVLFSFSLMRAVEVPAHSEKEDADCIQ